MSAERTIYVVEIVNVGIFALGIISQMLAVYTLLLAKRWRDSAKDWAASAKLWKSHAQEIEQMARELLAENERRYGVRAGPPPAKEDKPS